MALSDKDLARYKDWLYIIDPFNKKLLTPLGYDVSPGYVLKLQQPGGPKQDEVLLSDAVKKDTFVIPAKRSVIVITKEQVYLTGKLLATLHGRSRITQEGVVVNPVTVDPNWTGALTLYFYNTSNRDVEIDASKGIATLIFHTLKTRTKKHPDSRGLVKVLDKSGLTDKQRRLLKDYAHSLVDLSERTSDLDRRSNSALARLWWNAHHLWRQHAVFLFVAVVLLSLFIVSFFLPERPSGILQIATVIVAVIAPVVNLLRAARPTSRNITD